MPKKKSLAETHPEIAAQWHPTKNGDLTPWNITYGSNKKVWWKCLEKHPAYLSEIRSRTTKKSGCPYCAGKMVCLQTSIFTTHPDVVKEWDYQKNKKIDPKTISYGSDEKVWWKCNKGHSYKYSIHKQVEKKTSPRCPICCERTPKQRSLAIKRPDLLKRWDHEKNQLSPENIAYGSNKKFWWKCDQGCPSYLSSVAYRARAGLTQMLSS